MARRFPWVRTNAVRADSRAIRAAIETVNNETVPTNHIIRINSKSAAAAKVRVEPAVAKAGRSRAAPVRTGNDKSRWRPGSVRPPFSAPQQSSKAGWSYLK